MLWFIIIAVFMIFVIIIANILKRTKQAQERAEFNMRAQSRAAAYADRLLKVADHPKFASMSKDEIQDLIYEYIHQHAKSRKKISNRIIWISMLGAYFIGFILNTSSQIIFRRGDGLDFIILSVISLIITVPFSYFVYRKRKNEALDRQYMELGIDPEQLKINP